MVTLKLGKKKKQLVHPLLGFFKANAPRHYYFINEPIMRTRMFLSEESSPGIDGFEDGAVVMTCDGRKPIAHNFPINGELIPLGHLSKVVPDDILWKERDIDTAPMLTDDHSRWYARAVTKKEEVNKIKILLESYAGPPGSVSIPKAHEAGFVSQVGGLCEAIDPRGHRLQNCFKNYYYRWQEASKFSGQHFFDWLDFGEGRFLMERNKTEEMLIHAETDADCLRKDFDHAKVHYFDDEERSEHEVYLAKEGGEIRARYRRTDEDVAPNGAEEYHLYVWDLEKRLYVVDDDTMDRRLGGIKHTAVLAGRPALSAGNAYFGKKGRLVGLDFSSGHYRPGYPALSMMHLWAKDEGLNATSLTWWGRESWPLPEEGCGETDWEGMEIPGFDGKNLERS